jgi:hypothetical protein
MFGCPNEVDVRDAARSGRWPARLRAHAQKCRHCADVSIVTETLARSNESRPLPSDPRVLWMHARLNRRLHAEAQISRVVTAVQTVVGLALVSALAYLGTTLEVWRRLPQPGGDVAAAAGIVGALLASIVLVFRVLGRGGLRPSTPNAPRR